MAQKTIPQLNPLAGNVNDNTLLPIDTGTQTFKATALQVKNYMVNTLKADVDDLKARELKLRQAVGHTVVSNLKECSLSIVSPDVLKKPEHMIYVEPWKAFIATHTVSNATDDVLFSYSYDGISFYSMGFKGRTSGFLKLCYNPTANNVVAVSSIASGTNVAIITNLGSFAVTYQTAVFDSSNMQGGIGDFQYLPSHNAMFLIGVGGKVFKTTNGINYSLLKSSISPIVGTGKILEGKDGRIVATSNGTVYYSDDGGVTWENGLVITSGYSINGIAYSKSMDVYVLSGDHFSNQSGLMYCTNDEMTFLPCIRINPSFPQDRYFPAGLIYVEELGLFIAFNGGIMITSINGINFKNRRIQNFPDARDITIVKGNGQLNISCNTGFSPEVPKILYTDMFGV